MANTSPWKYSPSMVAAITFAIVYGILAIAHTFQAIRYRAWYCIPIIIGAFWEAGGYGVRAAASRLPDSIVVYAAQSVLIVLAPAFIAAFDYAVFGRILRACLPDERAFRIPPHLVTRIFVTCDVITFMIQSTGGGMLASAADDPSKLNLANHILTIGLILQVVTFGFFTAASIRFVYKLKQKTALPIGTGYSERNRKALMRCLWASCFLIVLRSIYRIVEFTQGYDGYLISHEVFTYIFEAVPMVPPLFLFNIWHPAKIEKGMETDSTVSECENIELCA